MVQTISLHVDNVLVVVVLFRNGSILFTKRTNLQGNTNLFFTICSTLIIVADIHVTFKACTIPINDYKHVLDNAFNVCVMNKVELDAHLSAFEGANILNALMDICNNISKPSLSDVVAMLNIHSSVINQTLPSNVSSTDLTRYLQVRLWC